MLIFTWKVRNTDKLRGDCNMSNQEIELESEIQDLINMYNEKIKECKCVEDAHRKHVDTYMECVLRYKKERCTWEKKLEDLLSKISDEDEGDDE
jgi:hypothetical protein